MMIYALDCEFNGMDGELISLALVGADGSEFYEVLPIPDSVEPWVQENVLPVLFKQPISRAVFQQKLQEFLFESDNSKTIVADWPDDIKYFCMSLITAPGKAINTPPLTFSLDRSINYQSSVPHNALEDAKAIMRCLKARY